ncbi:MAG TPA: hypothetical protein VGM80_01390, partial [Gaiellaceae bacterium]
MRKTRMMGFAGGVIALAALAFVSAGIAKPTSHAATPMSVCLVTDIGGLNDHGFNHLAYLGLQSAKAKLHV